MTINLFESILVPTDMSGFGDLALRYALHLSERLGSKLTLLYAEEISWLVAEHPVGYYFENVSEAKATLTRRIDEYATSHVPAAARVSTIFEDDAPESAIVRTTGHIKADLIVMGTHGRRGIRRALLGSVTERVLSEIDIPVITVNPSLFPANASVGIRTVLCPVNFTDVARAALEQASAIAQWFEAQLVVMHVCEGREVPLFSNVEQEFGTWVDPLVRANTRYKEVVVHGDAAALVLDVAGQISADLVVIGAQHRRFADATVIGTTTERITRFARQPVMTVIRKPVEARAAAVA